FYPLERVREMHISGGSWDAQIPGKLVRRDTHDEAVPEEVFTYLKEAIPRCPNLKFVVMEQLGTALDTAEKQDDFQKDFLRMDTIVKSIEATRRITTNNFLPLSPKLPASPPIQDLALYRQQMQLSNILETAGDLNEAQRLLKASELSNSDWHIEHWELHMLQTAMNIAQKWKGGF
uniref:multinuclear nonheme iron-dependent oxidase n=1 Tax=Dyadobacter sp. TaxID=1914288 RepID=UPI003F71FC1A